MVQGEVRCGACLSAIEISKKQRRGRGAEAGAATAAGRDDLRLGERLDEDEEEEEEEETLLLLRLRLSLPPPASLPLASAAEPASSPYLAQVSQFSSDFRACLHN